MINYMISSKVKLAEL